MNQSQGGGWERLWLHKSAPMTYRWKNRRNERFWERKDATWMTLKLVENDWKKRQDWRNTFVCWVYKLWNCLLMVKQCILHTKRHSLDRTPQRALLGNTPGWLITTSITCSCISNDLYQLLLLPLSIATWSCFPLPFTPLLFVFFFTSLQIEEVVCVQTAAGWNTVLCNGEAEIWAPVH